MSNKAAIFAGGLGGVAPNLVRLIVNYSSPSPQHIISQPVSYFLAMVGFAVLGALVVWVFQETNLKQALFLGIGLPSLFQIGSLQSAPSLTYRLWRLGHRPRFHWFLLRTLNHHPTLPFRLPTARSTSLPIRTFHTRLPFIARTTA